MLFNLMADAVGVSAGSLDWNESGEEPMTTPEHFEPQQCCSYDGGEGGSQGNVVCMSPHVFVFCVVLSALVSGIVVASQRIWDKLREVLGPVSASVHNPQYRHYNASGKLNKESEGMSIVEAAEAMDRAAATPMEHDDKVPARYVRAFCGNEKHASRRWKATLQWRKENDIDSILNEPQPFFHDIRRHFPSRMIGRSRGGHIVVYEKLGGVNMRALRDVGVTVPILLRHWIFVSEYMYRVLQPTDSAQQVTVEDMKGVQIHFLTGKIQEYVKGAAQLARLYYVERCHKTYVVNAPAWFGLAFRAVLPFLSARTRQKIRILGSDLSALQDEIDPQFLPVEYGGTNSVPDPDSSEERNLRRLVDAINANADAVRSPYSGNSRGKGGTACKPKRTPGRRASKAISGKDGEATPSRGGMQSRPGKSDGTPVAAKGRKEKSSSRTRLSRARTDDASAGRRTADDSIASDSLTPRRATWSGDGCHGPELSEKGAWAVSSFQAGRASRDNSNSLDGRDGGNDGWEPQPPWGTRDDASSGSDSEGRCVAATPTSALPPGGRDGDKSIAKRLTYGVKDGPEGRLPKESRVEAVEKDPRVSLEQRTDSERNDASTVRPAQEPVAEAEDEAQRSSCAAGSTTTVVAARCEINRGEGGCVTTGADGDCRCSGGRDGTLVPQRCTGTTELKSISSVPGPDTAGRRCPSVAGGADTNGATNATMSRCLSSHPVHQARCV